MIYPQASSSSVVDSRGVSSYAQLRDAALRVATQLLAGRGSLEGRRVAILSEPGVEFIAAFLGTVWAGGCVVVLSPLHPAAESAYFCEDSGAVELLVSASFKARALEIAPLIQTRLISAIIADAPPLGAAVQSAPDAPALQLYTSGTTGKPKGAVLTHHNLAVQQTLLREAWGMRADDVLLHLLPLHHMHGLCISLLNALGAGAGVSFVEQFEATRVWEQMGQSTVFMAVPTIYAKLLNAFDQADPATRARWQAHASRLRLATSGSAALPVTVAERWGKITGRIPLERFGMTELGVALSNPLEGQRRSGTVGLPLPSVQTLIIGDDGKPSQQGELWIAGPSVFAGYHRRATESAAAFEEFEGVRYFRTGDTVTRDESGYFRILGRTSVDILKSGGYKISALEIEDVLLAHPAVAEAAVIGVPDEIWGDRIVACVVLRPGSDSICTETTLREYARGQLAPYKVPKNIHFMRELPRNALGKVLKKSLISMI